MSRERRMREILGKENEYGKKDYKMIM